MDEFIYQSIIVLHRYGRHLSSYLSKVRPGIHSRLPGRRNYRTPAAYGPDGAGGRLGAARRQPMDRGQPAGAV